MKHSLKVGASFGITSGIITTLGLMTGLAAGTESTPTVIGGILTIAVADAFSDALGIHISEESENVHSEKEIWQSTIATFIAKFVFALTFIIPVIFFPLNIALLVSIGWGLSSLSFFSYYIARKKGETPWNAVREHILISIVVIIITFLVGQTINKYFS